uniref:Uncharacterized protein n=1 Tax=Ascaris lumbricoides TaxID=6252 RepID=A0A0M3IM68_ASCLU
MARRELYARIEPKYLTTCNMTVKVSLASSDFLVFMESFLAVKTLFNDTANSVNTEMARRELYARIEPKYLTTCNMTVKTAVIIFVSVETLLMTAACMCCFWFAHFNLGALCVAILVWLIFILFGAMIGFQWVLIPFGVLHPVCAYFDLFTQLYAQLASIQPHGH